MGTSIVGEGEQDHNVTQHAEDAPQEEEDDLVLTEEFEVEGTLVGLHMVVAVPDEDCADEIDDEGYDGGDAEGPREGVITEYCADAERVGL